MSDPGTAYRSRDEIKDIRAKHDPIKVLSDKILSLNLLTEKELSDLEEESKNIVEHASEKALCCQEPILKDMLTDVCLNIKEDAKGVVPNIIL